MSRPSRSIRDEISLLELHHGAGTLEGLLRLLGGLLVDALQDRTRCVVDELLGLLEPEAREPTDFLDDLDLLKV